MYLCGEANTRYPANIVFALLPSTLAILIIHYSKATERMTNIFCSIIDAPEHKTVGWCEKEIQTVFSNLHMLVSGIFFVLLFSSTITAGNLYPEKRNNDIHLARVRASKSVEIGGIQGRIGDQAFNATIGWAQVTLRKARQLTKGEQGEQIFAEWEDPLSQNEKAADNKKISENNDTSTHKSEILEYLKSSLKKYRWGISQFTYSAVMYLVLFMSGAMLWCLYGIIMLTWRLGEQHNVKVHVFPHPVDSIKAVGKFLAIIALINGVLYSVIMIAITISRPDNFTLIIASLFSLTVVATFVIPQYNLHILMLKIKYEKISPLAEPLEKALNKAKANPTQKNVDRAQSILQLQQSLTIASEWPFDFKTLITIVTSIIIPLLMAAFAVQNQLQ